ncbi:hypothetical protein [Ornithinicoccus hortensis]|uniref:Uncharacterized protein n=1 Tax=Ornithinicoccus hortensis TaxID=82346 RepID=A0A542YWG5_9MICO|nr:hypothetical protein [Ornithinicoccus hortensis]TQL52422.1 hypothetical protein FB467_3608 [Ornithinicoccus hortensis]
MRDDQPHLPRWARALARRVLDRAAQEAADAMQTWGPVPDASPEQVSRARLELVELLVDLGRPEEAREVARRYRPRP